VRKRNSHARCPRKSRLVCTGRLFFTRLHISQRRPRLFALIAQRYRQRSAQAQSANGEALQVQHYRLAGEYRSHYDYYPPRRSGVIARGRKGGQRGATLIVYLNDPFEGGATHFPNIGLSVAARQGGGLYFRYMNARRQLDPLTEHAGMPVLAGEKWIITKWMTEHPQEARIEAE
jgi:prolyl 4-hydroxylase